MPAPWFHIMILNCNMLTLLMARPCSSVSRMWRGRPSWDCSHALKFLLALKQDSRDADPRNRAFALFPHMHDPLAAAGSRVQGPDDPPSVGLIPKIHCGVKIPLRTRDSLCTGELGPFCIFINKK